MATFSSVEGMFLVAGVSGEFGVRKTNDLSYIKDNVIPGFSGSKVTHYMRILEETNFLYASINKQQILRLELVDLQTF